MAISFVQSATAAYAFATSYSTPYSSGNTGGNLLIALAQWADNTSVPTIGPDTNGNTWTNLFTEHNVFGSQSWAAWYAIALPGANTVPVSISGSAVLGGVALAEFSGVDTVDLNTTTATGSGTSLTSNSGATSHADELLLGFTGTTGGNLVAGGSYSQSGRIQFAGVTYIAMEYQIVNSTNTYTADASGISGTWAAKLASFFQTAVSTAKPVIIIMQ